MYVHSFFKGAKLCKFGGKWCVFGQVYKYGLKHNEEIKKDYEKNMYPRSVYLPVNNMLRVCFGSPFTSSS